MTVYVELRGVCTSTGRPRLFSVDAPYKCELRKPLADLDALRVDPGLQDAVLLVTDEAGTVSAWNYHAVQTLKHLFDEGEIVPGSSRALLDLREAVELAADPPDVFFPNAERYIGWEASRPRKAGASRPDRWDLLESRGRNFMRAPLPDNLSKGPPRDCFRNAATAVAKDRDRFKYVEGIAGGKGGPGGPASSFHSHAWITAGSARAIDVTWLPQQEPPSYFCVVFPDIEFVKAVLDERGGYGMLGKDGSADEIEMLLHLFPGIEVNGT